MSSPAIWRALVAGQLRSQLSYRSSFVLNVATSFLNGWLEFLELYVLLHNAPILGGLTFAEAGLVFAMANIGFSLGDLIFGQLDSMPRLIRTGKLELYLVRPMPLLAQLITSTVQPRRFGRTAVGIVVLVVALTQLQLQPSLGQWYLLLITPCAGAAIYGSWFVWAGGCQFRLLDGAEFTNAFVYGGNYASQLPGSVLITPIRLFFTFVVPALATAYLPMLVVLGKPTPAFIPGWLGWCGPVFALAAWLVALAFWRNGIRHYTSAGG